MKICMETKIVDLTSDLSLDVYVCTGKYYLQKKNNSFTKITMSFLFTNYVAIVFNLAIFLVCTL